MPFHAHHQGAGVPVCTFGVPIYAGYLVPTQAHHGVPTSDMIKYHLNSPPDFMSLQSFEYNSLYCHVMVWISIQACLPFETKQERMFMCQTI